VTRETGRPRPGRGRPIDRGHFGCCDPDWPGRDLRTDPIPRRGACDGQDVDQVNPRLVAAGVVLIADVAWHLLHVSEKLLHLIDNPLNLVPKGRP
jgi:hypothetical protein